MIYKNKKGDFFVDIILILLLLYLFWSFYPVIDSIAFDIIGTVSGTLESWLIRGFSFFLLLGIVRYIAIGMPQNPGGDNI